MTFLLWWSIGLIFTASTVAYLWYYREQEFTAIDVPIFTVLSLCGPMAGGFLLIMMLAIYLSNVRWDTILIKKRVVDKD